MLKKLSLPHELSGFSFLLPRHSTSFSTLLFCVFYHDFHLINNELHNTHPFPDLFIRSLILINLIKFIDR